MSWDAGTSGGEWDSGPVTNDGFTPQDARSGFDYGGDAKTNNDNGDTNGYGDVDGAHGGGNDGACFNCGDQGHMKSECPNARVPREGSGACFNCGETGHNKSDCPNPAVPREFTGECRLCAKTGHRASECPDAPPKMCKNCGEEGHAINDCKNARLINRDHVANVMPDVAWDELKQAVKDKDLDDIKEALTKYVKAIPEMTYVALEQAFRNQGLDVYVIALERELSQTYTNMDLQGNLDRTYTITYRLSEKPKRPKEAEGWPDSPENNMERLKDAGEPVDRGMPLCGNCEQLGHTANFCPEEKQEPTDRASVKCFNCEEVGHRVRDCPKPRPDKFACRNCKQSGHSSKECPEPRSAEGVECKKCGETGHFARDCPTGGGGDSGLCRNCNQPGHRAKECTEPRDSSTITCRNCDEQGHVSKECSKPRDYSRVQCQNCKKMGHTKVRCKEPLAEEDAGADFGNYCGGDNFGGGGFENHGNSGHDDFASAPSGGDGWS